MNDTALLGSWRTRIDLAKWNAVVWAFLVGKLVLTTLGAFTAVALEYILGRVKAGGDVWPGNMSASQWNPVTMWFHFDSEHYVRLAANNYYDPLSPAGLEAMQFAVDGGTAGVPSELNRFTFAPLLPFLAKLVMPLTGGHADLAVLLVVNVAAIAVLALTWDLTRLLLPQADAPHAVVLMMALPMSFLFQAALTESLFVALLMATLVLAEKRQWHWAVLTGVLVALSRSTGMAVAGALFLIFLRQQNYRPFRLRPWLQALPAGVAPLLGWGTYMVYCQQMTGELQAYNILQKSGWGVELGAPLEWLEALTAADPMNLDTFKAWSVVLVAAILLAGCRRIPLAHQAIGWVLLIVPIMMGERWYQSILRYQAEIYPVLLILVAFVTARPLVRSAVIAICALAQGIMFLLWMNSWLFVII
ncbi:glycosyltransferase family protein [Parenemella sanctibonifatiensis]|uniref:Uncharacterized protein n=1 Tax=Parenemella sanctibonifatiensis TaxID=2016505 RepID=A0A255DZG2_9ACTN|nr:hypothetical protein [Parenemella sanctibonifatiensis]OYN84708.1 hypothetical protein CGZ92_12855 [Parenemella sanctibonifatiensis]